MLIQTIDELYKGQYDFFYLPIDFKNRCNVGYAFINMVKPTYIVPFFEKFHEKKWEKFNSEKVKQVLFLHFNYFTGEVIIRSMLL